MPNVLDVEPVRAAAARVAAKISDEAIAERFKKLAFTRLLNDERNFRRATDDELASAPVWAHRALARGEQVSVFAPSRGAMQRLHNVARRLAHTCKLAAASAKSSREAAIILCARAFLDKFERVSFDVAASRALFYDREYAAWGDASLAVPLCPERTIEATQGRAWRRITSLAELRATGREFHNCLANTTRRSSYGAMLCDGSAQFWVLRSPTGEGLIAVMAWAPLAILFREVRGPRNTPIRHDHPDLVLLALALGMRQREAPQAAPSSEPRAEALRSWLLQLQPERPLLRRRVGAT